MPISEKTREYKRKYYLEHKEEISSYQKQLRKNNPEFFRKRDAIRYQKNRETYLANARRYNEKNRDARCAYSRNRVAKIKDEIFSILGKTCSTCGFADRRALQIDHVNGGGKREKARVNGDYYKFVLNKVKSGSKDYQILCANCNWIKVSVNNELFITR